jgi:hypothetical protein
MAKLTTTQANTLVDGGSILKRVTDSVYQFHKFSGTLNGTYYECATPQTHDLELDESTSKEDAIAAFKTHFKTIEHKGTAPVNVDETDW